MPFRTISFRQKSAPRDSRGFLPPKEFYDQAPADDQSALLLRNETANPWLENTWDGSADGDVIQAVKSERMLSEEQVASALTSSASDPTFGRLGLLHVDSMATLKTITVKRRESIGEKREKKGLGGCEKYAGSMEPIGDGGCKVPGRRVVVAENIVIAHVDSVDIIHAAGIGAIREVESMTTVLEAVDEEEEVHQMPLKAKSIAAEDQCQIPKKSKSVGFTAFQEVMESVGDGDDAKPRKKKSFKKTRGTVGQK